MGILDRLLPSQQTTTAMSERSHAAIESAKQTGTAALQRAGQFYKENPRKVQAAGLLAAALLLTRLKRR